MKKGIVLLLTLCTLVCILSSCSHRREIIREKYGETAPADTSDMGEATSDNHTGKEKETADTSHEPEPGHKTQETESGEPDRETQPAETGGEASTDVPVTPPARDLTFTYGNPYEGMTKEDLVKLYNESSVLYTTGCGNNTPYYYIYRMMNGGLAFSKLTGDIVTLCKDPLCSHEKCAFPSTGSLDAMVVAEDKIYYAVSDLTANLCTLYESDLHFDHIVKLTTWIDEDAPQHIFCYDGKIYYLAPYRHNGQTEKKVYVFDTDSKKTSLLEGEDENKFKNFSCVSGQYLYYLTQNRDNAGDFIRRYDLVTGEDTCVVPASVLRPEEGDLTMMLDYVEADQIHLGLCFIRMTPTRPAAPFSYRYNIESGECVEVSSGWPQSGRYTVSYVNHISDEYKDDPFYDLYVNNEGAFGKDNPSGGELKVYLTDGMIPVETIRFTTDGIPDRLATSSNEYFGSDGKCIFVRWINYYSYDNEYNPTYSPSTVNPSSRGGYMVIDVENKMILDSGEGHDVEWHADK